MEIYPPSEEFVRSAHVSGMDAYLELYRAAEQDPEGFWGGLAERDIHWFQKWNNVLDWNPARGFYEKIGFKWIKNWLPYRLSGEALETFSVPYVAIETDPDIVKSLRARKVPRSYAGSVKSACVWLAGLA